MDICGVKVAKLIVIRQALGRGSRRCLCFRVLRGGGELGEACVGKPDTSAAAGRCHLSPTTYNVKLMFKFSEMSDDALAAAANALKAKGVDGVTTRTSVGSDARAQGHLRHRHQQASNV